MGEEKGIDFPGDVDVTQANPANTENARQKKPNAGGKGNVGDEKGIDFLGEVDDFIENVLIRKKRCQPKSNTEGIGIMADEDRIVYPDEVQDVKAKAAEVAQEVESSSIEEPPLEGHPVGRNMIRVPPNCPPGQQRGADGVCRDVF